MQDPEIEITPEMIEAGVDELLGHDIYMTGWHCYYHVSHLYRPSEFDYL